MLSLIDSTANFPFLCSGTKCWTRLVCHLRLYGGYQSSSPANLRIVALQLSSSFIVCLQSFLILISLSQKDLLLRLPATVSCLVREIVIVGS